MPSPALNDLLDGAPHGYVSGTRRSVDPAETVRRITPHLAALGITRVANITGLDRIGIPVFVAVRPNSRSLSVSQGKGLTPDAARASAIGEALEAHHAEYSHCLVRLETFEELHRTVPVVDPELLPLSRNSMYTTTRPIPWTEGFDLVGRQPAWVPFELVHANACLPRVPGSGCFVCSTNGLAAGNTVAEAVLHGVCEVVERDACALWHHRSWEDRVATQLDLVTVEDSACRDLLQRFDDAGIAVMVWDVTSDIPLPTYRVLIADRSSDPILAPFPAAIGAGCHPDPAVALIRALTEAAQSRLTAISGSRDDLTRERYRTFQAADSLGFYRDLARFWRGQVAFRSGAATLAATVEEDLAAALNALGHVGIRHAVVVDLTRPGLPIAVARTIIPGLEGPVESPSYRPGPRLVAMVP